MSDALLTRIAQMESELAQFRGQQRSNEPAFDKRAFIQDPTGYMAKQFRMTPQEIQHVNAVNLAVAMGDQAPPDMRYIAQQGPLIAQQSTLQSQLEQLSRQVQELVTGKTQEVTVNSLKALIADKSKYPHLSTAYAKNPGLYDSKIPNVKGTAEEIAKQFEDEAAAYAQAFGVQAQPASENAGVKEAQSTQSKPAPLAGGPIDPPPLPKPQEGEWTPEEDKRVRVEIARKFNIPLDAVL